MKRICAAALAVLLLCPILSMGCHAEAITTSATSAILVDAGSGRVLWAKSPDERRLIASITKLMTALVAVELKPDLSAVVTVKREYTLVEGSSMYLREGEEITLEGLLYGLLLSSGNDAALAIADYCGGSVEAFVAQMNRRATELGMTNTHFSNPNGLNDDDHYSTAADMAKVAVAVLKTPAVAEIVATKNKNIAGRSLSNHNKLLWQYEGCIGMKTGFTERAGRTLVSAAQRNGQVLVVVTLNDPNDWRDHTALFDYGFATYPAQILARGGKQMWAVEVPGSLERLVWLETAQDVYYPLKAGERVTARLSAPSTVAAPVVKGQSAGELTFYLDGKQIAFTLLVYTESRDNIQAVKRKTSIFG